jgi:putative hydrolase of the HAD superfamily
VTGLIPPEVRVVVFDAVGTLIHPDPPAAAVYSDAGRLFGSRHDAAKIAARFSKAFRHQEEIDLAAGLRTDEAREVARWQGIVAEVLDDVSDPTGCFRYLYEHFALASAWRTEPDAAATFAALKARGYGLGIASNFDGRLRGVAEARGFRGMPLVISAAVGWRKPAGEFFAAVCRACGAEPREILYVGDDAVNDYFGAKSAGLASVLLDPNGRAPLGVPRVARLGDVLAIPTLDERGRR